jgi:hypothetical protein
MMQPGRRDPTENQLSHATPDDGIAAIADGRHRKIDVKRIKPASCESVYAHLRAVRSDSAWCTELRHSRHI